MKLRKNLFFSFYCVEVVVLDPRRFYLINVFTQVCPVNSRMLEPLTKINNYSEYSITLRNILKMLRIYCEKFHKRILQHFPLRENIRISRMNLLYFRFERVLKITKMMHFLREQFCTACSLG